jgi:hypothetical protein
MFAVAVRFEMEKLGFTRKLPMMVKLVSLH